MVVILADVKTAFATMIREMTLPPSDYNKSKKVYKDRLLSLGFDRNSAREASGRYIPSIIGFQIAKYIAIWKPSCPSFILVHGSPLKV